MTFYYLLTNSLYSKHALKIVIIRIFLLQCMCTICFFRPGNDLYTLSSWLKSYMLPLFLKYKINFSFGSCKNIRYISIFIRHPTINYLTNSNHIHISNIKGKQVLILCLLKSWNWLLIPTPNANTLKLKSHFQGSKFNWIRFWLAFRKFKYINTNFNHLCKICISYIPCDIFCF